MLQEPGFEQLPELLPGFETIAFFLEIQVQGCWPIDRFVLCSG